jgi:galactokinase/mevalonate kinase-like predicted kinase
MRQAVDLRRRRQSGWQAWERKAFERLRDLIVGDAQLAPAHPRVATQEDQIVWARSPVRLDLAGGWTDTPPYCLEYGGKVVNLAAHLNGQPPIQVFARAIPKPEIVLRSIDLGEEVRLQTYADVENFGAPFTPFALARAALAVAGFSPRFHARGGFSSLQRHLRELGGGLEITQLSAVPKGSGLGASSILAATLLAALNDLCGLQWDRNMIAARTLALEQLLTTGGGWQDQAGAIYGGVKLLQTTPGLRQQIQVRWLPEHLFQPDQLNRRILLYYTGITRLAKNILQEIVRQIFLNSPQHLETLAAIGRNAEATFEAIQRCDYLALADCVNRSWQLNQALDSGTNPPPIQRLLARLQKHLAAAKLLGAGGGGFLLMLARDEAAAEAIRRTLTRHPPNPRARFVQLNLSTSGLQVTRS